MVSVDDFPSGVIVQYSGYQSSVDSVSAALCFNSGKERQSKQGKIADNINDLVPHKLVVKSQSILVHQAPFGGQDDRILEAASADQSKVSERLDLRL